LATGLAESIDLAIGRASAGFLIWNLFLAWVSLPVAFLALLAHRRGAGLPVLLPVLAGWLLFFPNTVYIVTDLVHLGRLPAVSAPLELAVLLAAALAGLITGFTSLAAVQRIVLERAGSVLARVFPVFVLVLSSFGVYLGRTLRWNSWDLLANPEPLLSDVLERLAHPLSHPFAWSATIAFSLFLLAGYRALCGVTRCCPVTQPGR